MLKEIFIAIDAFAKAHRFIRKHRLWKWIWLPGICYMLMFMASIFFFWQTASSTVELVMDWSGLKAWLMSTDSGFWAFVATLLGLMVTLILMLGYFSLFKYLWLIVGSPVFAFLSEKTESIIEERDFPFSWSQLLKDMVRGIRLAFRNALWQTVYNVAILLVTFVPVVGLAAPVLALFIECYYYGFSMLDYSCERHKLGPQESIRFIGRHKGLAIGNGLVFYLMHLIPFVGWVVAPTYAVVSATLSLYHQKDQYL